MQLTDALLEMEEEKAIWFAREKATVEAINGKAKSYSAEIANVSQQMTEVTFRFAHDVVEQFKHILEALQWLFLIWRISSRTQYLHTILVGGLEEHDIVEIVTNKLESCRIHCKLLVERLVISENNVLLDKSFSEEKLLEIDQLRLGLRDAKGQSRRSLEMLTLENQDLCKEVERLQMELSMLSKEGVDLLAGSR